MSSMANVRIAGIMISTLTNFSHLFRELARFFPIKINKIEQFFFADHRGVMPPVILENSGVVHVAQDESTSLVCVAQACPTPEYR